MLAAPGHWPKYWHLPWCSSFCWFLPWPYWHNIGTFQDLSLFPVMTKQGVSQWPKMLLMYATSSLIGCQLAQPQRNKWMLSTANKQVLIEWDITHLLSLAETLLSHRGPAQNNSRAVVNSIYWTSIHDIFNWNTNTKFNIDHQFIDWPANVFSVGYTIPWILKQLTTVTPGWMALSDFVIFIERMECVSLISLEA